MNHGGRFFLFSTVALIVFSLPDAGNSCGPWFPESLLKTAYAVLQPPKSSLEIELEKIDIDIELPGKLTLPKSMLARSVFDPPRPKRKEALKLALEVSPKAILKNEDGIREKLGESQSELAREIAELGAILEARTKGKHRIEMLAAETTLTEYRDIRGGMFGVNEDPVLPPIIKARAWPEGIPREISLYLNGAAAFREKKWAQARAAFEKLLALPADERKHRSIWASYLLGRIELAEGDEGLTKSIRHFRKVLELYEAGFHDSLGMRWDSLKCVADHERSKANHDKVKVMKYYFALARAGQPYVVSELSEMAREFDFSITSKDPMLRKIVTAVHLGNQRGIRYWEPEEPDANTKEEKWLSALESEKVTSSEANRLGWLAYNNGKFNAARRWLRLASKKDEMGYWIESKLALQSGSPSKARDWLNRAAPKFDRPPTFDAPAYLDGLDNAMTHEDIREYQTAQFWGDRAMVRLANNEFTGALDAFVRGGFWFDAAYVAEQILSREELLVYVRKYFSEPFPENESEYNYYREAGRIQNKLRYLTARRLARDRYFKDARDFFPEEIQPVFDHYVKQYRAFRRESNLDDEDRGEIGWETAQFHRSLGMELFGTEVGPDWFCLHRGNFSYGSFTRTRFDRPPTARLAASNDGHYRNPVLDPKPESKWQMDSLLGTGKQLDPTYSEKWRFRHYAMLPNTNRFHYRHVAADLAWEASLLLPNNYDKTAEILNTAGSWIAVKHPKAADVFYKSLVNRNRNTLLGLEADTSRWFPRTSWSFDPWKTAGVENPDR